MYPDNRNFAQQQPQQNPYDSGDDQSDFQGTLLDPYWGNQGYRQQYASQEEGMMSKSKMWLVAAVLGVVALGFAGAFFFAGSGSSDEVPVITADATPYKTKPTNPGGIEIPFQDKLVFNRLTPDGQPVQAERLLPPAEQPMELALQPDMKKPSEAVPPMPLSADKSTAEKAAASAIVDVQPAIAKIAPTEGAVPPAINDTMPVAKVVAEAPAPKAAPVAKVEPKPAMPIAKVDDLTMPAPKATPVAKAVEAPKPVVEAKKVETPKAAPAVAGGTRVQLASIPERAAAEKALSKLQGQYGSTGVSLSLVKADLGAKGVYWRVQSQPMDKAKAQKICDSVKAQGGACIFAK